MAPEQGVQTLLETSIQSPLPEDAVKKILSSEPFIPISQALNLRTISSTPYLRPNLIFRSGSLEHLPPSSLAMLKTEYNITTIFDLRSQGERKKSPSPFIDGIETVWIPSTNDVEETRLVDGKAAAEVKGKAPWAAFAEDDGTKGFVSMYGKMLETHKPAFKAVFEKLRDGGNGGLLFHCTAGKDRTGVLSALILALLDAPEDVIVRDYALTRIGTEPFREHLLRVLLQLMGGDEKLEVYNEPGFAAMCGVRGQSILAFLNFMDEKWGSSNETEMYPGVKRYVCRELGFNDEDLKRIRNNLGSASSNPGSGLCLWQRSSECSQI